jgi:hypothetical protein
MGETDFVFNQPPGWPVPPKGWKPAPGWKPDPTWPAAPEGWNFWIAAQVETDEDVDANETTPPLDTMEIEGQNKNTELQTRQEDTTSDKNSVAAKNQKIEELEADLNQAKQEISRLEVQKELKTDEALIDFDDEKILQEVGIYQYHHPLENSEQFKDRLKDLQERIKSAIKNGEAIESSDMFTFNNSLAKGRKMTLDLSKLMLRAYNAEADNCIRSLRAGNPHTAAKRLERSVNSIAKLGSLMEIKISESFHLLRLEEIDLTSDYLMKKQEEKEAAREERAELREQKKAEQELAAKREQLDKERNHFINALGSLNDSSNSQEKEELEQKIENINKAIEDNDYRIANIRAGYVYVISNKGSFRENVIKIGLTRRLDPMDRVRELGDASVPFPFDVHALFFSEDAVTLENELHKAFNENRLNRVNTRREFFFASPEEVRQVLADKVGNLLEFKEEADSTQYLQSKKYWNKDYRDS